MYISKMTTAAIFGIRIKSDSNKKVVSEPAKFEIQTILKKCISKRKSLPTDSPDIAPDFFNFFLKCVNTTLIISSKYNNFIREYGRLVIINRLALIKCIIAFSSSDLAFLPAAMQLTENNPECLTALICAEYILKNRFEPKSILNILERSNNSDSLLQLINIIKSTNDPKALETIIFFLNSDFEQVRESASQIMLSLNNFRKKILIGKLSVSDNLIKRKTGFLGISLFLNKSFLPIVLNGLNDKNSFVKIWAEHALKSLADKHEDCIKILDKYNKNKTQANPDYSESDLPTYSITNKFYINNLKNMLNSDDYSLKKWAFSEIKEKYSHTSDDRLLLLLINTFDSQNDFSFKSEIAKYVSDTSIREYIPNFIKMLNSDDPETVVLGINCLSSFDDDFIQKTIKTPEKQQNGLFARLSKQSQSELSFSEKMVNHSFNPGVIDNSSLKALVSQSLCDSIKRDIVNCDDSTDLIKTFNKNSSVYKLIEEIGSGGMGKVFKAQILNNGNIIAIKIMYPHLTKNPILIARFKREAEAKFKHPNIVEIIDSGSMLDTIFYIAMEYVEGQSLQEILTLKKIFSIEEGLPVIEQICSGFGYAHSRGCFHRDVKPENILLTSDNTPRITDFGLIKAVDSQSVTTTGTILGTPYYIPPEQARGLEADNRSDIYSIGIIMFRMFAGRLPFRDAPPMEIAKMHITYDLPDPCRINPDIPKDIRSIILKCTDKNMSKRYQKTEEIIQDIKSYRKISKIKNLKTKAGKANFSSKGIAHIADKITIKSLLKKINIKKWIN